MPNPTPKKKLPLDLGSLARAHTEMCVKQLCGIAINGESENARVGAIALLLDRGWGKAAQPVTGADGGALEIIIRDIIVSIDPRPQPKVIEGKPNGKT